MILSLIILVAVFIVASIHASRLSRWNIFGDCAGMARVTLGPLFNSISGSIGEMVNATWKGINYIRSKAKTISNPQSEDQADIRARITECSKYWTDVLTDQERGNWETYSNGIVVPSSGPGDIYKPAKGPFSGYTAFMRNNTLKFTSGQSPLGTFQKLAPIGVTSPDAPTGIAAAGGNINVQVSWTPGTVPGTKVCTWLRSRDKTYHPQIIATTAVASGISISTAANGLQGVSIPFTQVRTTVDVQVMVVDAFGQPSPASTLVRGVLVTGI